MAIDRNERFLVSVQWGAGPHYFITPKALDRIAAVLVADGHIKRLKRELRKRGALPIVRVLEILIEVPIKRSNV